VPKSDMMSRYEDISCETRGPVAWIFHNRPGQRNAQGETLLGEMAAAIDRAVSDENVRVIVVAGKGDHFSAGHDLKTAENSGQGYTVEQRYAFERKHYYDLCLKLWDCPKPTIAAVQGACVAGAFMLANACDLLVAADDAFFSDPVVSMFGAAAVEVLIHPTVAGMRMAKDMLFTGRRIDSMEALACGMASRRVPRADLERTSQELAEQIAGAPPFALKLVKRSLHRSLDMKGFRAGLEAHFDTHQLSHISEEFSQRAARALAAGQRKG
jgi:enoyl-CoA hydratase